MPAIDDQGPFWERLFRCGSWSEAAREIAGEPAVDPALARIIWQAHGEVAAREESLLAGRARDLEALAAFGRALSGAHALDMLLERTAFALQVLTDADAVAVATALPERTRVEIHVARGFSAECATQLRDAVAFGFVPVDRGPVRVQPLPAFDRYQGTRDALLETDILVVPVERRGREIVRVAVVPRAGPTDRALRALFGASNHLALHVDRVLAVAEAEQGRFRAILDSMPHAVVLTDSSFQIMQANVPAERLMPRLGPNAAVALRGVGDLDLAAISYDVLAGRSQEAGGEALLPDGGRLQVSVAPWRSAIGPPEGLVIVMLDVTVAWSLRDQITRSEKLSSLGRMIAGVAHELNNPLTSVIGYAQLLRSVPSGDKLEARLVTLGKEAERCRRIVQNLLRFARIHTPERRPFSLNEAVENAAQWLAYAVRQSGCRTVLELDRELPAVTGDVHEIEQALVNLVTNAQQAMVSADRPGAITIRTGRAAGSRVAFEVDDEGPGIPDGLRGKLFDPFFTTKPQGQGTGLGLWLVANAVEAHGGSIVASESASGGARFRVELPAGGVLATPAVAEVGTDRTEPRVSARILVVDAEAALAELICEALTAEGHRTVAVHDARDALDRLNGEPFDLVVTDALLPGLPGERLAREVERVRPDLRSRILLTTGDSVSREPEAVARRLNCGLLRKPFELDELRRVVALRLGPGLDH